LNVAAISDPATNLEYAGLSKPGNLFLLNFKWEAPLYTGGTDILEYCLVSAAPDQELRDGNCDTNPEPQAVDASLGYATQGEVRPPAFGCQQKATLTVNNGRGYSLPVSTLFFSRKQTV